MAVATPVQTASSRTLRLKEKILSAPYCVCIERARYVTEAYKNTEGLHPSVRAAAAFENTLRKMTVFILDEERIAGNQCSQLVGVVLPVERGDLNVVMEMDLENLTKRERQPYKIGAKEKKELLEEILPWWKGRTIRDGKRTLWRRQGLIVRLNLGPVAMFQRVESFGLDHLGKGAKKFIQGREKHLFGGGDEMALNNPNLVNNVFDDQGHLIVGHNRVIEIGFKGVRDAAAERLKSPGLSEGQRRVLESVVQCCEAARIFAGRFADLARQKAEKEGRPGRKKELLQMAAALDRVPWEPPMSFYEAVQFLWLTQDMAVISHGTGGICAIGRPDQYLYPWFKKDIESGAIDEAEALELIEELLVKLSVNLIPLPSYAKDTASELGADSMAPTVGGLGQDGEDATNELSFLFVDAIKNLRGMSNSYSIRISAKTKPDFYAKISDLHTTPSAAALYNDEAIVPALVGCGYSPEEARDYGIIGCVEPTGQGDTFGCTSGNDISLVGILEMTLTGGTVRMVGRRFGPRTGNPERFETFEDFMKAFEKQLAHTVDFIARCVNAKDRVYMKTLHNPFLSSTLAGCVENGKDITEGGARHNFGSMSARGLATTSDSLCAIKKFVYDEKTITMRELREVLRTNFRGKEKLRRTLAAKTPRYGADNDEADAMARRVAGLFCDEVTKHRSARKNGPFRPSFFSYGMHVYDGSMLGATPDGRRAGEPVSNSLSPVNGAEKKGPTAAFSSAAKIDHVKISNGCSLNMKMFPSILDSEPGRRKFEALIRGYFGKGGMHVQFNMIDDAILRDAQRNPDQYRDLVVRVSGYSAYFTDLGKSVQDDIIRRTAFGEA